ncbi:TusE/DsrC/DsvC family sulfur relay protein [Allofrancisella guangzhouensis]|uniref:Sulfurtransferase n=1 Tax=Allofrancisella guangzhouensis TaxID=594679 RepID=A0A0A8E5W9_9GAMM|nr:TusE/DsrC/DsvC family sulfur relay protein [Allofrancisella guangzhouensis]AJC49413.1 sulfur transfer protein TusE [Allofrancisella guangzhouensis]MBK2026703.1 TusE/DsrC/DsvC family sulfur relay protein [Allofrancisella guangzhouensis]MBK2043955.1 TusE/DsrC/DsvC family sulfur relay protein [Allofrancisella guangzhouensis]MBK2046217.1 TusE/DsrC/DsvC family sulfur relay protein [Allofrancisella guangzhouensis]
MDNYNTDSEGFLLDFNNWDVIFCQATALEEGIILSSDHMVIINFLRSFYNKYEKSPAIRELISALKKEYNDKLGNSLYLQKLFPISPAVQAAKLAGLPKPKRCI